MHPDIEFEYDALRERFPGKVEITLTEYAECFSIVRTYANLHLKRVNEGQVKIPFKRVGKKTYINLKDLAYYLAHHKHDNGRWLNLPSYEQHKLDCKRKRGFCKDFSKQNVS